MSDTAIRITVGVMVYIIGLTLAFLLPNKALAIIGLFALGYCTAVLAEGNRFVDFLIERFGRG